MPQAAPDDLVVFGFGDDRHLDLIAASSASRSLVALDNRGGRFAAPESIDVAPIAPVSLAMGGLVDGTTGRDLVLADGDGGAVTVLRHLGGFAFEVAATYDLGEAPRRVVVASLDRDRRPDIAVLKGASLTVLFAGAVRRADRDRVDVALDGALAALVAAEVTGDRWTDLVVAGDRVDVLENLGDRRFRRIEGPALRAMASSVNAADLDRDGDLDVLATLPGSDRVGVLWNDGRGRLALAGLEDVGPGPLAAAIRQLDDDRLPDVAVACRGGAALAFNSTRPPISLDADRDGFPDECTDRCPPLRVIVQERTLPGPGHVSPLLDAGVLTASAHDDAVVVGELPGEGGTGSVELFVAIVTDGGDDPASGVSGWSLSARLDGAVVPVAVTTAGTAAAADSDPDPGLAREPF